MKSIILSLVVSSMLCVCTQAADKPAASSDRVKVIVIPNSSKAPAAAASPAAPVASSAAPAANPAARAVAATGGEYERMPQVFGLTGDQLQQFQKKLAQRNEGYDKWANSPRGKQYAAAQQELESAKRSRNAARLAEAERKYRPLRDEQESVRRELRREFNAILDPAQRELWAGYQLYDDVIRDFANLSEVQKQQAFVACATIAAIRTDEGAIQRDPYLKSTRAMKDEAAKIVTRLILNSGQKSEPK